ncbi:MAG: hypothetical protein DSO02_06120 [Hadesarchaea archaeon]|nr:MAG: hypothetical protein DSO02_06120 [Hadesarchaea archaeon]
MLGRKGQGAIEYLLILAAVLIVVAGAVYYVTRMGGFPAMTFGATLSDNTITLEVDVGSGTIKQGDWQYRIVPRTGDAGEWRDGVGDLSPGESVSLKDFGGVTPTSGDELQIKHTPSGHIYKVKIR